MLYLHCEPHINMKRSGNMKITETKKDRVSVGHHGGEWKSAQAAQYVLSLSLSLSEEKKLKMEMC